MELLQLRYFAALAESENLTKTASDLYISPSSLSLTISKLEKELGVKLFDRVGRKLQLNQSGKDFLAHLRTVLSELDFAVSKIQQKNTLSVLTEAPSMWVSILSAFAESHPNARVNNRVARRKNIVRDMMLGEYDFWLSVGEFQDAAELFHSHVLSVPALYLAVPHTNPLAARSSATFEDLKGEKFIFPFPNYPLYETYLNVCTENGLEPNIVAHCSFLRRMELVSAGEGISIVDESVRESDLFKRIVFLSLSGTHTLPSRYIYWRKDRKLNETAQEFLETVSHYYQDM